MYVCISYIDRTIHRCVCNLWNSEPQMSCVSLKGCCIFGCQIWDWPKHATLNSALLDIWCPFSSLELTVVQKLPWASSSLLEDFRWFSIIIRLELPEHFFLWITGDPISSFGSSQFARHWPVQAAFSKGGEVYSDKKHSNPVHC